MSRLDELIGLLEEISKGTPEEIDDGLERLNELLRKIGKSKSHVHIEVDYDGREFHWKVPVYYMSARELNLVSLSRIDSSTINR